MGCLEAGLLALRERFMTLSRSELAVELMGLMSALELLCCELPLACFELCWC